jgi:hypothetical protein
VRGQDYLPALTLAPTASKLPVQLQEVNGALIFVRPPGILDLPKLWIYEHQTPRAKKRVHPLVVGSYISIEVSRGLIEECAFQVSPTLNHSRQEFRAARVEGRIKP